MAPEMMIVTNNPNVSHWSLENGYDDTFVSLDKRGYPIRVFNVKHSAALTIFLQLNGGDVEYRCRGLVPGFKVQYKFKDKRKFNIKTFLDTFLNQESFNKIPNMSIKI